MTSVKIVGAGSIGNHLAQAARRAGWGVTVTDRDPKALRRMRDEIYPARYGCWDPEIRLLEAAERCDETYDAVFIGTPPDSHLALATEAVQEGPKVVIVEKPLCSPNLEGLDALVRAASFAGVRVLVGFDHAVGRATRQVEDLLRSGAVGRILTIDVEFREHWEGIFAAHPWLEGPADSYLGYSSRGGGASGEHSHATHLWQHFAHVAGAGAVNDVRASLRYVDDGTLRYDEVMWALLTTESDLTGSVVQDVITRPSSKRARLQGEDGRIEWIYAASPEGDEVRVLRPGRPPEKIVVRRSRPDDFFEEMQVVAGVLKGERGEALSFLRGSDTMLVLAAAHRSHGEARPVSMAEVARGLLTVSTSEREAL